jgi:TrmH family RNA methyltransferase
MSIKLKRYKKTFEHSYTFGVFPTLELLHHRPESVYGVWLHTKGEQNRGVHQIRQLCAEHRIRVEAADSTVERLSPKENVYAVGVFYKYAAPLDSTANHVVLANPGNMGNLGTITRTMLGFGFHNLALIRPAVDVFHPNAVRSAMGAIFQINHAYYDSFEDYADTFNHALYPFMTSGRSRIDALDFSPPFALVFGNESSGLPEEFGSTGTSVVIPYQQKVDSLNLAIAVGIALYESTRGQLE